MIRACTLFGLWGLLSAEAHAHTSSRSSCLLGLRADDTLVLQCEVPFNGQDERRTLRAALPSLVSVYEGATKCALRARETEAHDDAIQFESQGQCGRGAAPTRVDLAYLAWLPSAHRATLRVVDEEGRTHEYTLSAANRSAQLEAQPMHAAARVYITLCFGSLLALAVGLWSLRGKAAR